MKNTRKLLNFKPRNTFSLLSNRLQVVDKPSIWGVFGNLAISKKAANLGSGFPNWEPPEFFKESIVKQINSDGHHTYGRAYGHPGLVATIAKHYSPLFGRELNAENEIVVSCGAIACVNFCVNGFVNPGDEVVMIDPYYPEYDNLVKIAGGKAVNVALKAPKVQNKSELKKRAPKYDFSPANESWELDYEELDRAINAKTRILMLNSPHNPSGKIFTMKDYERIADIVRKWPNLVVISDEVYEHNYFSEGGELVKFATLPGMWNKTLTVSSAGKIFAATGVRIGWTIGPSHLTQAIRLLQHNTTFSLYGALQLAISDSINIGFTQPYKGEKNYLAWSRKEYIKGKNLLLQSLLDSSLDFRPWTPEGGFFVVADISNIDFDEKYMKTETGEKISRSFGFSLWLGNERRVISIPMSPFYSEGNQNLANNLVRFALCKTQETIKEAGVRLK